MRTIKDLDLKVEFTIKMRNIEVTEEVFEELENAYHNFEINMDEHPNAYDWFEDNVNVMRDYIYIEYKVDSFWEDYTDEIKE